MRLDVRKSEGIIAGVLGLGSGLSIMLMAAGLGLLLAKGETGKFQGAGLSLNALLMGAAALEPAAIMTLGVIMLLFTPMLGVVAAGVSFLLFERDIKFALISLGVLVILTVSIFIPGFE